MGKTTSGVSSYWNKKQYGNQRGIMLTRKKSLSLRMIEGLLQIQ
jgi:hypothetical protein